MNPDSEDGVDHESIRPAQGRHRALAERIRRARIAHLGDAGVAELARRLGVPERTWRNYEDGVTMPAEVVLRFMELTGVTACDLLHDASPAGDHHPGLGGFPEDGTNSTNKPGRTATCKEPLLSP